MIDVSTLGTIVGVWAHPDDDIYLSAGLMAAASRSGQRVVDVTATRGEGGSMDEERWPPETMAEVRTKELQRSLEILGVSEHHFLEGPIDQDMDAHLDEAGASQVLELIRRIQPTTILTFGPDGMTGHQGHKDVSRWATQAFHAAAPSGSGLYYATQPPEFEEILPSLEQFNIFRPGTPPITPHEEMGIDLPLTDELLDLKIESIQAHESQIEGLLHVFGTDGLRRFMRNECFRRAEVKR
jgi:LmbE family N-acetylglucosaminyl deacetylase